MNRTIEHIEERIGYRFKKPALLLRALTHSSYANEHRYAGVGDNERLEFLGDAVLELASSEILFHSYPDMPEGDLTKLRASLVCEPTLALCARDINLPSWIMLGNGEENTGGRMRNSIVSDALEALIGAIYLDGGFASAKEFIQTFIMNDIEHKKLFYDSKTILQELVQRDYRDKEIAYCLLKEEGPDHAKHFTVCVKIGDTVLGEGSGSTKKAAEQEAAYHTLITLRGQGACI